ncbi:hypothetical protein ACQR1H_25270 [Bradyrhizobium sp. HKCCYLRH2015]|uniref:hypothetical protein n=1 Tax=unclassified Bradyrhizobium TaxID=2631580 RepID=UPI002916F9CF|nr:hypothetical protein [Bradyrhizobium sp. SZCCHNR3003]
MTQIKIASREGRRFHSRAGMRRFFALRRGVDGIILQGSTLFHPLPKVEQMRAPHLRIEAPKKPAASLRSFWSAHSDLETALCLAFMLIVGIIVKMTPPT